MPTAHLYSYLHCMIRWSWTLRTVCLLLMVWVSNALPAQIVHTARVTLLSRAAGLEYQEPVEQWLHVVYPPEHEYMRYDLALQNDRNDYEVRLRIRLPGTPEFTIPEPVEITRLLATIAINEPLHDIRIQIPPPDFLSEAFNAEQGLVAYFRPKPGFSEKPFGALISLFAEQRGAVDVVILYRDEAYDALSMFRNLRFRKEE